MKSINKEYAFSEKWSPEVEQYSFTQIPNLLLGCQGHLKLRDGELLTLIHLLTFWFDHDGEVYPSIATLTRFSHKGYSTIQRRLRVLEEKGFVKRRHKFGMSNTYDLKPCVAKLYKHQAICHDLPHKRAPKKVKVRSLPSPLTSNKEYQLPRRLNKKTSGNTVPDILRQKYGEKSWTKP